MGLEGLGEDGAQSFAAADLAQRMEDIGTLSQNAEVLNLLLAGANLLIDAPKPISESQTTEPVNTVVFNDAYSRERYGRSAVNDLIALETDRRSLLLDGNQTNGEKAEAILGALELDNGLSAVQSMSDGDVTGTTVPANIDSFNRRPDAMYQNTSRLSVPKRDHLVSAFTGNAEPEYVAAMVSQAGGTAGPTTFSQVVSDQVLMNQIAADAVASTMLASHPNGGSQIGSSQTAMQALAPSQTGMQSVASSQTAMQSVAASQTAMQEVVASQTAMQEVAPSQTAMQEVAASQTAMEEVVASQTAMQEVANSQASIDAIGSNSNENITESTVLNSTLAEAELSSSSLEGGFRANFGNAEFAGGINITNQRVLVTSNNTSGDHNTGISFSNDVGPEVQPDSTFIINSANVNRGDNRFSGDIGFRGLLIN